MYVRMCVRMHGYMNIGWMDGEKYFVYLKEYERVQNEQRTPWPCQLGRHVNYVYQSFHNDIETGK